MSSTPRTSLAIVLIAGACGWPVISAQAQTAARPSNPPGANAQNAPSQFDSQPKEAERKGENLSERLDRTDGVIKPPANADSDIHVTPPPTGDSMAVPPPDKQQVSPK